MQRFAQLFIELDQTTLTTKKVDALARYFAEAGEKDKLWTIALLSHRRPKRTVTTALLRSWAAEISKLPLWLFEDSYHIVGDLAETIALTLPLASSENEYTLSEWIQIIQELAGQEETQKKEAILNAWDQLNSTERFVFNKLITGGFRMGVSQKLMTRALAKYTGIEENKLAHRLMGNWSPNETTFEELILSENADDDYSKPYPFYLAYALDKPTADLGLISDWQAEYKWDGIRGQLIVRGGEIYLWSRGEELITDKFPEFGPLANILPQGTVLDGEILPYKAEKPLPFQDLQTRIGRKNVTKKILENVPVILMAYDLLEIEGEDIRRKPISERRQLLEKLLEAYPSAGLIKPSKIVHAEEWDTLAKARAQARENLHEGIMLKKLDSPYEVGRKKGNWWKWKVDPYTIDAVMLYAQSGHGRRANLFSDYTFAVWDGDILVPFAKAYSGLTDVEIKQITQWVRKNTKERFGPVRSVNPELVFELAFEGINRSSRHKSGIALRFPRILRWRKDKPASEANTLGDLVGLLRSEETK